jgi:hypothetical protein
VARSARRESASLAAHTWCFKPLSIDWFYARLFLRLALDNPDLLTGKGFDSGVA